MFFLLATTQAEAERGLIGHWRLQNDCRDSSGRGNHGTSHGAVIAGDGAAAFDGKGKYIEVSDSPSLHLGTGEFSVAVWVRCDSGGACVVGDIVSKYDAALRRGINLGIHSSASGYNSVCDTRNLFFGIDNAAEGPWVDCGRPWPTNPLVSALAVYRGQLYAGISDASDPKDACHVFRCSGGQNWIDCGRVGGDLKTLSVHCLIVHKGALYAGTSTWDWEKTWQEGVCGAAGVYRYEGGARWHDCGQIGSRHSVLAMASYAGNLYAADDRGSIHRYERDGRWVPCGQFHVGDSMRQNMLRAMAVYQGKLYGSFHGGAAVCRYDGGTKWTIVGADLFSKFGANQAHKLQVFGGELLLGTWPEGSVLRYEGGDAWADLGWMGVPEKCAAKTPFHINEINELVAYNGKLYAGVIPLGEVWRYDGKKDWTRVKRLVVNPAYSPNVLPSWCRVPCMAVFQGRLYAGTGSCQARAANAPLSAGVGKVFAWEAGRSVSYDDDLGCRWRHIVAIREKERLALYVDGQRIGRSAAFDPAAYDLSNHQPLRIGFGAENYFHGSMRDLRLYGRALTERQIGGLFHETNKREVTP